MGDVVIVPQICFERLGKILILNYYVPVAVVGTRSLLIAVGGRIARFEIGLVEMFQFPDDSQSASRHERRP